MASLKTLINNLVITKLDFCNSIYYGLPNCQLVKLQGILNRAARLILGVPFHDRITPALIELHWLPIKARIIYKICVLTYQALKTGYPEYISQLLVPFCVPSLIQVRHAYEDRLVEPRARNELGERTFSNSAPHLFNSLPLHKRSSPNIKQTFITK